MSIICRISASKALKTLSCETRAILREAIGAFRRNSTRYILALLLAAPILAMLMRVDPALADLIRIEDSTTADSAAGTLSRIGKTDAATLWLCIGLFASSAIMARPKLRRLGLCIILAVIVSGIGVNLLRPAFGRARPYSENAGSFHPITLTHEFNGFPSGHSSEAWTLATVISISCPPAALPACTYALSMQWARVQRKQHFPSDVIGGMLWGVACALPFGIAYRRLGSADKL